MKLSELLFVEMAEKNQQLRQYSSGLCGEFAAALSQVFGYELGIVVGVTTDPDYDEEVEQFMHAFCFSPVVDTVGIDAIGIRPVSEMVESVYYSGDEAPVVRVRRTSRRELDELTMEGLFSEVIEEAVEFIERNRRRYEVV